MTSPIPFDDNARHETFDIGLEKLLAGDNSGLDDIEPQLWETALEMVDLARAAGWTGEDDVEQSVTPSVKDTVPKGEERERDGIPASGSSPNGRVPSRTANRATGTREDIMQVSGTVPAAAAANPWQGSNSRFQRRTKRTSPRATSQPVPAQRMRWSGAANTALTVLLIMAAFGVARAFEGSLPFDFGGNGSPEDPRIAAVPGTPDESLMPAVQGTPEASADAAFACDFSDSVPIYIGLDEPPAGGTALYVTQSHDLMVRCDEEPEDILLEEDIVYAGPTSWPGVVNLAVGADAYEPTPVFLNLLTNERLEYGQENSAMTRQGIQDATLQSPFVVTTLPDDSSTWALTDLRTMDTRTLTEIGGVEWPRNSSISISENGAQGTFAIGPYNDTPSPEGGPELIQPDGFPGEIMLVSNSLDGATWADIPDDMSSPYSMSVSPNGEHVAVLGMERPESPGNATISILSASDGIEITRTDSFRHNVVPNIIWTGNGEAVVYPQDGALMKLEAESGSSPAPLLESSDRLFALSSTHHPDVVTISESDASRSAWRGESDRVYAVNTSTGSIDVFEGRSWQPGAFSGTAWQVQAAIILIEEDGADSGTTTVIDPATGEVLLEIPRIPTEGSSAGFDESFPADTLVLSRDRSTVAFTIRDERSLVVANVSADPAFAQELAFPDFTPPEDTWSTQISLSPEGSEIQLMVYTEQERQQWSLDLSDPEAEWVPLPDGTALTWLVPVGE